MLVNYLYWQFVESPKKLFRFIVQTHKYIYNWFSISYLLKTLFAPWRRDISYIANPSLSDYFKMFVDNALSRFLGFLVRFSTIVSGLVIMLAMSVVSLFLFIVWFFMPVIIVYLFIDSRVFF